MGRLVADAFEEWLEQRAFKVSVGLVALFIFSGFQSCAELKYSIWGESVEGNVIHVQEYGEGVKIKYRYVDQDGQGHKGVEQVSTEAWLGRKGDTVRVTYIPGTSSYRLESKKSLWPLTIFGGMTLLIVGWFGLVIYQGSQGRLG